MNDIEDSLDGVYQKTLTKTELFLFYKALRKWVVENWDINGKNPHVMLVRNSFYEACKQNYPDFYLKYLYHLDGENYQKEQEEELRRERFLDQV